MANDSQPSNAPKSADQSAAPKLPVPESQDAPAPPAPTLPTGKSGELSPAQRARLGLDVYGEQTAAPAPEPVPEQPAPLPLPDPPAAAGTAPAPVPAPTPAAAPAPAPAPSSRPSDFGFSKIDPFEAPTPAAQPRAPSVTPVSDPPRHDGTKDGIPQLERDRSVLTYGVAWTLFALLVSAGIAFSTSMSRATGEVAGPGPLVPAIVSIGLGWVIVIAARSLSKNWAWLMIVPAVVLFLGPFAYASFWSTSVEDSARTYLSPLGQDSLIDVDQTSIVSETINTDRGCFAITRERGSGDTEVAVVTSAPETARQQADMSLAPRYARRVPAGGERGTHRVFTFKEGRNPPIVSEAPAAPLDCATRTAPASNP